MRRVTPAVPPAARSHLKIFWQLFRNRHSIVYSGSPNRPADHSVTAPAGKRRKHWCSLLLATSSSGGGSGSSDGQQMLLQHAAPHRCDQGQRTCRWPVAQEAPAGSLQGQVGARDVMARGRACATFLAGTQRPA